MVTLVNVEVYFIGKFGCILVNIFLMIESNVDKHKLNIKTFLYYFLNKSFITTRYITRLKYLILGAKTAPTNNIQ